MKIALLWVGKTRNASLQGLIQDYWKRISHFCELTLREVPSIKSADQARLVTLEGEKLLSKVEASEFLVLLDPSGQGLTTENFATFVAYHREHPAKTVVFALGGHAGFSAAVRRRADFAISLSPLTFTHEMARYLLVEQIYRAFTIIHHLPYHK